MTKIKNLLKSNIWVTVGAVFVLTGAFGMGAYSWLKSNTVDRIKGGL